MLARIMANVLFIILSNEYISGGEKRTARLFQFLIKNDKKNKYNLVITKPSFFELNKQGIIIPCDYALFYSIPLVRAPRNNQNTEINNKSNTLISIIKKIFYFYKRLYRFIHLFFFLKKTINKKKIDILYPLHMNYAMTISALLKRIIKKLKLIITYNDSQYLNISKGFLKESSSFYLGLRHADVLDFPGKYYFTGLPSNVLALEKKNVFMSPCSFVAPKNEKKVMKKNHVVFAHRFIEGMNPLLFVKSAKLVLDKRSDIHFYMLGFGPLKSQAEKKIKEFKIEKHFTILYTAKIIEILQFSKIFVTLRNIENYHSQSLLEAMLYENAIISSNVGESEKLVNCETGFLVSFSETEIAEKIIYLLENEELRAMLGENASRLVSENHRIENYANYFTSLFLAN